MNRYPPRYEDRRPDYNRGDVFTVVLEHDSAAGRAVVGWHSRYFGINWRVLLSNEWIRSVDPRMLEAGLDRQVGNLLRTLVGMHTGRDLAEVLRPILERESVMVMEELERHARDHYFTSRHDMRFEIHGVGRARVEDPEARKKARALLLKHLNFEQKAAFKGAGTFQVKGQDGKQYKISAERSFNVTCLETGNRFCGQLADTPIEDQMLAQKLLLENEPEKFFKNTNMTPGSPPRQSPPRTFEPLPEMTATEIQRRLDERVQEERRRHEAALGRMEESHAWRMNNT